MGGGSISGVLAGTIAGDVASSYVKPWLGDARWGAVVQYCVGEAGALALGTDLYNRQLHSAEKTLAQKIADDAKARGITNSDGSPITVDQVENAMRSRTTASMARRSRRGWWCR